jgi:hypothetical protein
MILRATHKKGFCIFCERREWLWETEGKGGTANFCIDCLHALLLYRSFKIEAEDISIDEVIEKVKK